MALARQPGQPNIAVRAGVNAEGRQDRVAAAGGVAAARERGRTRALERRVLQLLQREVDAIADPRVGGGVERGGGGGEGVQPALQVRLVAGGLQRLLVGLAAERHLAAAGGGRQRGRAPARARAGLAIRRDLRHDERRVLFPQRLEIYTFRGERARRVRLDHGVRAGDQLLKDGAVLGGAEIECERALAGVVGGGEDAGVGVVLGARQVRSEVADRVALGRLDEHDVRAVDGEQARREGAADVGAEVDHAQPVEHRFSSRVALTSRAGW